MPLFDIIAFDADDTLWHTERLYQQTQSYFFNLLSQYNARDWVEERLYQTEVRNLEHFGFGTKAFALSMIETAVELTEGRITGQEIQLVINWAREMLKADIELLPLVAETLAALSGKYRLMLLTKGDLLDQQLKIARSALGMHFKHIEIVSDKRRGNYETLLARYDIDPRRFMMIGNSLKSDILPVLELGGSAVYIPSEVTWKHDLADVPAAGLAGFYQLAHIGLLPGLLDGLEGKG